VAGSEKAHVVFGHLYSAKYLINPVDIPTSKGKKSTANIRAWVTHAMEDLLKLVGRKKAKQAAVNLFKNAMALQLLSTTVARLFASKLKDSQIRRASTFVECTAQQLKGVDDFRTKLKQAMDGLLTAAEDKRDNLSINFAGYEDDIQKMLYAYNDGRPSRFNEVVFEDFDSQELEAARRKGFGNARAVRKLFEVKKLVRISDENYERELKGQETVPPNGEVVKKTAADFIGSHVSESQTKTSQILDMAKGKVLVIDDAYNLNDNMYGKQVLDACRLQYAFHFEDYMEHELLDILEWNSSKRGVTSLKHAMGKAMSRPMVNGMTVLALEDVGVDVSGEKSKERKDPIKLLDKLYLVDEIKEQLTQLRNQMIVADCEGSGLPEVGHFVFRGSPGTVKTVARVMTEILHGMDQMLDRNAGLKSRFTRLIDFPD
ncbi:hypothetical protein JG688_00014835, partial [Phytophthora aleatoria]